MQLIKRIFIQAIACTFIMIPQLYGQSGMNQQNQKLLRAVTAYLKIRSSRKRKAYLQRNYGLYNIPKSLVQILSIILEKEAQCFGPGMCVSCNEKHIASGRLFNFGIMHKLSKAIVCNIELKKYNNGSFNTYCNVNPNGDGCIKNSENSRLKVGTPVEAVFVKNGKKIKQGSSSDFSRGSKNVYKVQEIPSLYQKKSGPCGYYSLFNILQMFQNSKSMSSKSCDYGFMLGRKTFEPLFASWKKYVKSLRGWYKGIDGLSSREIERLIRNKVPKLYRKNVMISFGGINEISRGKVVTFDGRSIKNRIRDFRINGSPQYLIVSTKAGKKISGLTLGWNDRSGRLSCLPNHWIAIKIEWKGRPQQSPVILSVADSGRALDNRFTALIHWYYHMFVHARY